MMFAILFIGTLCATMVLPYLPGRFDASAAALSFAVQVTSYASLLLVPVGVAWVASRQRSRVWRGIAQGLAVILAGVFAISVISANQLALGVLIGIGAAILLRSAFRRLRTDSQENTQRRRAIPVLLVCAPLILVAFRTTVLPRAASWSRDRAIRQSAPLIAAIESFRGRRGHYPLSLQSLNRDVPTGVIGIERFHYEPNGHAFNLFFTRQHLALDAREVVMFNPRNEHRFTSHEMDILEYDGAELDLRRGDGRRSRLPQAHWVSFLFD
jgi:hypothetical protein